MIIAADFDGTLVRKDFPRVGEEVPLAVDVLKYLVNRGHKIILYTCRTHTIYDGHDPLQEAIDWCTSRGIELYAVNDNPESRERYGGQAKVSADMYIDDNGFGTPMVDGHVDWSAIKQYFYDLEVAEGSRCEYDEDPGVSGYDSSTQGGG